MENKIIKPPCDHGLKSVVCSGFKLFELKIQKLRAERTDLKRLHPRAKARGFGAFKIKALLSIALLIALLSGISASVPAYAAGAANLEVFVANVNPSPVEPGKNLILSIILKNSGTDYAPDTTASLKASYPFTIKTVQNEVSAKNMCVSCASNIIYALSVDSSAKSGSYPVELEISYGSGTSRVIDRKTVNIDVVGSPRITFRTNIANKITPKSEFDIGFQFTNMGTGDAKDIKISTASQDFIITGGTPIVDSLHAGETKNITVSFISSPNILPNVYSIPITLNYVDELGNQKDSSSSLGISVLGNSDLIIKNVKIDPTPIYLGNEFTITARVQNIGYGDAKEVVMELQAPYRGYKKAFIGKLGKDEDAPAIFNLRADSMTSDAKITIKYRDDFGEHEKAENIAVNVNKISNSNLYYLALALAAIVAFAYRKRILKAVKE